VSGFVNVTICDVRIGAGYGPGPECNDQKAHPGVAAGAIVTKDVPAGFAVAGDPARALRYLDE
jgi:hypothetical protein